MLRNYHKQNKNIVFLTRPITPPWDESSKNFALYIANAIKIPHVNFLFLSTKANNLKLSKHMKLLPIHHSDTLNIWTKLRFFLYLLTSNPDCIHSLTVFTPLTGLAIKILKSFKHFKAIQTITSLSNHNSFMFSLSVYGDIIVTFSKDTEQKLKTYGISSIIIPPGVPTNSFKPAKKEKVIAFLGELYRLKSYHIVKDLITILEHSFPDYTIVLGFRIKNKPPQEKLLVQKLKIHWKNSASIKFVDIIDDMPSFLKKTKLVIFPATSIAGKFDFPLVLLEALASGTPIVISKVGPLEELSSLPGVSAASPNSAEGFFNSITEILQNYDNFSKAARQTAEDNFSIEQVAKKYEEIYKKIL